MVGVLLVSALSLELIEASIVAGCAVMVRAAFRAVMTPVVPSPAIPMPPVLVAVRIAESPCVLLFNPMAPASLVPVVCVGSDQAWCERKRTEQNHNHR